MHRPDPSEYASYYATYIDKVPGGEILDLLKSEVATTVSLLAGISEEKADWRYEERKWSIKDVVGHLIDAERTFGFRAFWFARQIPTSLPGIDQDPIAESRNAGAKSLKSLTQEFASTRESHLSLFRSFDEEAWLRRGVASDCEFSVRALAFILVGHEIHHRNVLSERYLG